MDTNDLKITNIDPATPPPLPPASSDNAGVSDTGTAPAGPAFTPILPPPSEHHPLNTGLGTEHGDNAKTMVQKINDGFANVLAMLESLGAKPMAAIKGEASDLSGKLDQLLHSVENWCSETFVSITDHKALADKVASMEAAMTTTATLDPAAVVPKADFDALKAAHDDLAKRFETLGSHIEAFLGLDKK